MESSALKRTFLKIRTYTQAKSLFFFFVINNRASHFNPKQVLNIKINLLKLSFKQCVNKILNQITTNYLHLISFKANLSIEFFKKSQKIFGFLGLILNKIFYNPLQLQHLQHFDYRKSAIKLYVALKQSLTKFRKVQFKLLIRNNVI